MTKNFEVLLYLY